MKNRTAKKSVPRSYRRHHKELGILHEFDVRLDPRSRLKAKVLIFKSKRPMQRFCDKVLDRQIGYGFEAAVMNHHCHIYNFDNGKERQFLEVDPRYVCTAVFHQKALNLEIISHESVHVGHAYAERNRRRKWPGQDGNGEEAIAYPSGIFTQQVIDNLFRIGYEAE